MNKKQLGFFKGATETICKEARKPVANDKDQNLKDDNINLLKDLRRAFAQPFTEEVAIKPEQTTIN